MTLTRIHHVALVVQDVDRALGFYRDLLGMRVSTDRVVESLGVRGVLLPMAGGEIEIIEPLDAESGVARFLAARGEGLHHVCFQSTDIATDLRIAAEAGMQCIDGVPRDGLAGRVGFIHPRSNHGVLVEYAQPPSATVEPLLGDGPATPRCLDHLVLAVRDPSRAAATFARHFGMRETAQGRQPQGNARSRFLELGGSVLEIAPLITSSETDPLSSRLAPGEGLFMLAVAVRNVDAAVAHLRAAGVGCTDTVVLQGRRRSVVPPRAAHGVRLQLVGP